VDAAAAQPRPQPLYTRLAFWAVFVGLITIGNYAARFGGTSRGGGKGVSHEDVYSWSFFASGLVIYAFYLGIVLLICVNHFELLALRPPRGWARAAALGLSVIIAIVAWEYEVVSRLPLPESPAKEQGVTNVPWEPKHAGAFAANFVLFALIAPFVEELTFRGAGQSLLRFLGSWPSILIVGVAFGLSHGLVEALLVLVPFGIALAWLRDRTDSVLPGMVVHGIFNGAALVAIVLS
jgi:membrane protease YdiL (CAAX protease family)